MNDQSYINYLYQPAKNNASEPLPKITLTIRSGKLVGLDWFTQKTQKFFGTISYQSLDKIQNNHKILLKQIIGQLDAYFSQQSQQFDLPLDLSIGTEFEQQVWRALQKIPYGQTISYATLAKMIGKPTAYRAAANANGKNPIPLIIPCHRVIASSGKIGGYTGGVFIKEILLQHENQHSNSK